jgi:hypothetical protein
MRAQLLEPLGTEPVDGVVRRLCAVPAQSDDGAALAIGARRERSEPGDLARALADGTILKTFAFRGATHLLAADDAGAYLALRASSRMWELPSWRRFYRLEPSDWPALRAVVREALVAGPLTRDELGAAVTARPEFAHLGFAFEQHAGTLLKPFAWQGDMSFGPSRNGRSTFQRLDANPRWQGLPPLDVAGMHAVEAYFRAYGPATPRHVQYWLGEGLGAARKGIEGWIAALGSRLATIDVEGEPNLVLADDLDELVRTAPSSAVRFLPGFDQWVLGPGTSDAHVVPPPRRGVVTRGANIVIAGGVVSGTWSIRRERLEVSWFGGNGPPPEETLSDEVRRLAGILERTLEPTPLVVSA